jgi:hypothetical protein
MKVMWLNESLVLRGETKEEKKALNVVYQSIGNEPNDEPLNGIESSDPVDVLESVNTGHQ